MVVVGQSHRALLVGVRRVEDRLVVAHREEGLPDLLVGARMAEGHRAGAHRDLPVEDHHVVDQICQNPDPSLSCS